MAVVRPLTFSQLSLQDDPDGLRVAEDASEILAFAFSWATCGSLRSYSCPPINSATGSAKSF
jgi:hypothetical protein